MNKEAMLSSNAQVLKIAFEIIKGSSRKTVRVKEQKKDTRGLNVVIQFASRIMLFLYTC